AASCRQCEGVGGDRVGPEIDSRDGALLDAAATCASRVAERVHAGESLIRWAPGPFAMSRVRGPVLGHPRGHEAFLLAMHGDVGRPLLAAFFAIRLAVA